MSALKGQDGPRPGAGNLIPMSKAASTSFQPVNRQVFVPLKDLGLAPENMRFNEPADEGVPQLADTIEAAGVLIPIAVRPGRKKEQAAESKLNTAAIAKALENSAT